MVASQLNRSYLWAYDEVHGWNYTTYFSFFNDFDRKDENMKYFELTIISLLSLTSVILNVSLIAFFLANKELRTLSHMFVISVLCANLFLLPFALIIGLNRLSASGWMFSDFVCRTTMYAYLATAFMKIWLMSIISIDRYLKVVHPPNCHLGRRASILLTIAAWTLPTITLAIMVYPNTISVKSQLSENVTVAICSAMFKAHPTISYALIHFATVFVLEFMVPTTLMTASYVLIMRKIRKSSQALMKHNTKNNKNIANKLTTNSKEKRTTMILIVILVLFLLMWTPLFGLLAALSLDQWLYVYALSSRYIVGQLCMLIANTIIEPVLFALTTGQVRQKLTETWKTNRQINVAPISDLHTTDTHCA